MNQINIATKKFTDAVKIDIGQLPVTDVKIDFNLTDGSNPVIAENKTFSMTIGTVNGELYKTDDDTVSYRYLKFDDNNVADSLAITMKMNSEEILNDTVSLTYQTSGGIDASALDKKLDAPATPGTVGQVLTKTADGQEWDDLPDENDYLCFTAAQADSTVGLDKTGAPPAISLEYSTDKVNWTEYTWDGNTGATITLANVGDSVWWRGDNTTFASNTSGYYTFKMSWNIEASGNIMSLIDRKLRKEAVQPFCFFRLFLGCSALTKAPELPAKTLNKYCYSQMFYNCTSLTKAPELPATNLANYCYSSMFYGCSALTKAPELPAKTLAENCYKEMFYGCTSLTKAPELPAETLANNCYYRMFYGCTSLTKAPELNAKVLGVYCCNSMFYGCSQLQKVKVNFIEWKDGVNATDYWLYNVSSTGVLECPSALYCSTRDKSHVPAGWTIVRTDAPKSITSPTTASSAETYQVSPTTPSVPVVTVASALTLNASAIDSGSVAYAEIVLDVATGATVTAGTNITLVDTPTAGKRNICVCRWSGGVCKLYVTIVEDLPQA